MTSHLARGMTLSALVLLLAPAASAQTTTQLWGNLTLDWVKSDRLVYELDVEPKALIDARGGIGYRRNFNWRYELLYIWTRSRNTIDTGSSTTENIIDVRVKRLF